MANIYGPQANETYNFSVPVATSNELYGKLRAAAGVPAPTVNPDGRGGRYFVLPFSTEAEKAQVADLIDLWKRQLTNHVSADDAQYLQPIMNRLGAKPLYNPAGEIDGYLFRNAKTDPPEWAPAERRYGVAAAVVELKNKHSVGLTADESEISLDYEVIDETAAVTAEHSALVYISTDENLKYAREELKQTEIVLAAGDGRDDMITTPLAAVYLKGIGTVVVADPTLDPASAAYAFSTLTDVAMRNSVVPEATKAKAYPMLEVIENLDLTGKVFEGEITSLSDLGMRDVTRAQFERILQRAEREYQEIVKAATEPLPSESIENRAKARSKDMPRESGQAEMALAQQEADALKGTSDERDAIALRDEAIAKITINGTKAFSLKAAAAAWNDRSTGPAGLDMVIDTTNTQAYDRAAGHERTMETGGYTASDDVLKLANRLSSTGGDAAELTRQLMLLRDEKGVDLNSLDIVSLRSGDVAEHLLRPMVCEPFQTLGVNRNLYVVEERAIAKELNPTNNRFEWTRVEGSKLYKTATPDNVVLTNGKDKFQFQYKTEAEHFLSQQGVNRENWQMTVKGPRLAIYDAMDGQPNLQKNPMVFMKLDKVMTIGFVDGVMVPKTGQWGGKGIDETLRKQADWIHEYQDRNVSERLTDTVQMPNGIVTPKSIGGQDSRAVYDTTTAAQGHAPTVEGLYAAAESARQKAISDRANNAMMQTAQSLGFDVDKKMREMQEKQSGTVTLKQALASGGFYVIRDTGYSNKSTMQRADDVDEITMTANVNSDVELTRELQEVERSIATTQRDLDAAQDRQEAEPSRAHSLDVANLTQKLRIETSAAERLREDLEPKAPLTSEVDHNRDDEEVTTGSVVSKQAAAQGLEWSDLSGKSAGQHVFDAALVERNETIKGTIVDHDAQAMIVHETVRRAGTSKNDNYFHVVEFPGKQANVADTEINGIPDTRPLTVGQTVTVRFHDGIKDSAGFASVEILDEKLAKVTKQVIAEQRSEELLTGDKEATKSLNDVITEKVGPSLQRKGYSGGSDKPLNVVLTPARADLTTTGEVHLIKVGRAEVAVQVLNSDRVSKTNQAVVRVINDQDFVKLMKSNVDGAGVPKLEGARMTIVEDHGRAVSVGEVITKADVLQAARARKDREEHDREIAARIAMLEGDNHEESMDLQINTAVKTSGGRA